MINFAFFGTDEFSTRVLETLKNKGFLPSLIVTVPDQAKGRKMIVTPPPAKIWAMENKIKFIQPASLKMAPPELADFDFFVVASYGKIIPQAIIDLPKLGILNVHPSILPQYRGASPLESTILSGDTETGVSIILIDAEMDHGPIFAIQKFTLSGDEYFTDLRNQAAVIGGEMLAEIIPQLTAGKLEPRAQDHTKATFTKKIVKEDGLLDLADDPILNYRKIRAFNPWPGTYFLLKKKGAGGGSLASPQMIRIVIKKAHLENGALVLDRVVPEGKSEMNWEDFKRNL